jgi:hypothetical protein
MKLVPFGPKPARRMADRYRKRPYVRTAPVRTVPLPVKIVRRGDEYSVVDGVGGIIGTIPSPGRVPTLGRNEETVFLLRGN